VFLSNCPETLAYSFCRVFDINPDSRHLSELSQM
jgi:hypothetical protein